MKKPKIGYLLTPITFGGSEKVNLNFLSNVDRAKYDIHPMIIIRPWEGETFFENELLKMKYRYSRIPVASNKHLDLLRYLRFYNNIRSIVKKESIDLLHTHGYLADILGLFVAKSLGIPIVSTCHGFIINNFKLRLYYKLDLLALKYFSNIIAVSNNIKNFLVVNKIKSSILHVIPNAVEMQTESLDKGLQDNKYRQGKEKLVLGFIGRISEEKGINYLIEAYATLKDKHISASLLIIGEGPELSKMQQLAEERKVEKDVHFLGFQNDILPFLEKMDIFVLPSLTEGTPLALLEAMSAKVPVVATRVGGVPDLIENGITGVLVNPCNHMELADAISKLFLDNDLRISIINNAAELIEKQYSLKTWISKIQIIYDNILNTLKPNAK
jgi:glycosyltransferase involved in cell wall biosynthesis